MDFTSEIRPELALLEHPSSPDKTNRDLIATGLWAARLLQVATAVWRTDDVHSNFVLVASLAIGKDNLFYLTFMVGHQVAVYRGTGEFVYPHVMALNQAGFLYVSDAGNHPPGMEVGVVWHGVNCRGASGRTLARCRAGAVHGLSER